MAERCQLVAYLVYSFCITGTPTLAPRNPLQPLAAPMPPCTAPVPPIAPSRIPLHPLTSPYIPSDPLHPSPPIPLPGGLELGGVSAPRVERAPIERSIEEESDASVQVNQLG